MTVDWKLVWEIVEKISLVASIVTGIGAVALAIYLSRQETKIKDFGQLLEKNSAMVTLLSEQNKEALRIKNIERKGNLNRLKQTWLDLMEKSFTGGKTQFDNTTIQGKTRWIQFTLPYLESELNNPILLEYEEALQKWHGLYMHGKLALHILGIPKESFEIGEQNGNRKATLEEYNRQLKETADAYYASYNKVFEYLFKHLFHQ